MQELRKKSGYSAKEVINKLGISYSYLSKIENHKEIPSLKRVIEFAKLYEVPISVILEKLGINTLKTEIVITKYDELIVDYKEGEDVIIKKPYRIEVKYLT